MLPFAIDNHHIDRWYPAMADRAYLAGYPRYVWSDNGGGEPEAPYNSSVIPFLYYSYMSAYNHTDTTLTSNTLG